MTAAIFDTAAISLRLKQLRGEEPTGSFYRQGKDGKLECLQEGHDWVWGGSEKCSRCGYTYTDLAPARCPGKIDGEACIECGKNAVVTIADNQHWSSTRCLKCGIGSTVSKRVGPVEPIGGWVKVLLDAARIPNHGGSRILAGVDPETERREKLGAEVYNRAFEAFKNGQSQPGEEVRDMGYHEPSKALSDMQRALHDAAQRAADALNYPSIGFRGLGEPDPHLALKKLLDDPRYRCECGAFKPGPDGECNSPSCPHIPGNAAKCRERFNNWRGPAQ